MVNIAFLIRLTTLKRLKRSFIRHLQTGLGQTSVSSWARNRQLSLSGILSPFTDRKADFIERWLLFRVKIMSPCSCIQPTTKLLECEIATETSIFHPSCLAKARNVLCWNKDKLRATHNPISIVLYHTNYYANFLSQPRLYLIWVSCSEFLPFHHQT